MRIKHSIINISAGIGSQIIITLLSFISRTVFITYLGVEYLGINGLFSNILGMLSLAEAGIGSAIIFHLYKPVAENDETNIKALLNFYKKAYIYICLIIFVLGISLLPFLEFFTKDTNIEQLHIIYLIFLINTISSYLFAHKISFLKVCQKGYVVTSIYTVSSIVTTLFRLMILYLTQDFILYLIIDIIISTISSYIIALIVDKKYPFLKNIRRARLDSDMRKSITKNIKSLVLHRIGGYAVFGTDNLLISIYVSVSAVGLYSNYYMLINTCRVFISQIFDNINHSFGNLIAGESKEKVYDVFKVTMLCNFWIYSAVIIFLYFSIEPLISLWLGSQFLMSHSVLIILLINFYVSGMRKSITTVKLTAGIFNEDRYAPLIEAFLNLLVSIFLAGKYGITGIFLGTLISTVLVPFWNTPYLVYKNIFKLPVILYFKTYFYYLIVGIASCYVTNLVIEAIPDKGIKGLIYYVIISALIPSTIYYFLFNRTKEFAYLKDIACNILLKKHYGKLKNTLET
ncbi:lipopolysaccharide biosynthesis protein [Robertmurraya sp. GLU-23]